MCLNCIIRFSIQNITPYLLKIQDEIEDLKGIMLKRNNEFANKEIANDPKKFKEFDAIFKTQS